MFLISLFYGIGDFDDLGAVHNYNADNESITVEGKGEEKTFSVSITGFSRAHFDAFRLRCQQRWRPFGQGLGYQPRLA